MTPGNPAREVIEAVARAICDFKTPCPGNACDVCARKARAAIEAHTAALSAAGMVIVRTDFVNAAHEMVTNGDWCEQLWCVDRVVYDEAYTADLVRLHIDAPTPTLPPAGDEK